MADVTVSDASALDITGGLTVEVLARIPPNQASVNCLLEKQNAYELLIANPDRQGGNEGFIFGVGDGSSAPTQTFDFQKWMDNSYHMFSATYSDTNDRVRLYVDGNQIVEVTDETTSLGTNNNDLLFGKRADGTDGAEAFIDEVRIWSAERTASEIDNNKAKNLGGSETDLAGLWEFSAGSGTTITDQTSNNNDGTATGTNWVSRGINVEGRWSESHQVGEIQADVTADAGRLPELSEIGTTDVATTEFRLSQRFSFSPWTDPIYMSGASHGEGSGAFSSCVILPNERVLLIPNSSPNIGIYDPFNDTYTSGPAHGEGDNAFAGGALLPDGRVVMAPHESSNVGLYDYRDNTYTSGPAHGETGSQTPLQAFNGATLAPDGRAIFCPFDSFNVGIFDPSNDSYSSVAHGQDLVSEAGAVDNMWAGAVLTIDGRVVFVPEKAAHVGLFDPSTDTYSNGPDVRDDSFASYMRGGALVPDGRVVMAPNDRNTVGLFDPSDDSFVEGPAHGEGDGAFRGAVLMSDGRVCLVPNQSNRVGIFDPSDDSYTSSTNKLSHEEGTQAFIDGVLIPDGKVILASSGSSNVGIVETFAQISRTTTMHPFIRQTGA